ncbi:MAG TPA: hypothetical protein EYN69_06245 [Flavobacteriales bacterium]|nr:hypothetical protein [Flavobacteriales bacterium]
MASRIQNITIDQGADYLGTFVAYSSKSATTPKIITNFTANSQIRKSYYHANAALTFATEVTLPATGTLELTANNLQTSALAPGRYVYDIEIASNGVPPTKTRIIEGIVTVTPESTKIG